jgi:alpha-galactosidase/6-phospho-beta-glucosidase family protein
MGPTITIIGGGSHQWVPKLITDIAHHPALKESQVVLEDIDASRLPLMQSYVEHVAKVLGIPLTVRSTTDQRAALDGADFVIVNISTGGFDSMAHDLDIPARYGIQQTVGDTVGPGGIMRALRNIPVFLDIAADMRSQCPDAWMLNLTNPMTAICRGVTKETPIKTVGLCHEVTITSFFLSLLLGVGFFDVRPTIAGVNHLPVITALDAGGDDGLAKLADLLQGDGLSEPLPFELPDELIGEALKPGETWTKQRLADAHKVKFELFRRTGGLPAAGDRHLVEFFAGFLTEESGQGARWGVQPTPIAKRRADEARFVTELQEQLASDEVSDFPSGEMVHTVIGCLTTGDLAHLPLNIPNAEQCPDLPADVVVESMCVVDGNGIRGRDVARAPGLLAEQLRRVSASQELVVAAGVSGDRDQVVEAMLADPLAGRIDYDRLVAMTDEMLAATKPWLPQFA